MGLLPGMRPGVNVKIHTQDERAGHDDFAAKLRKNAGKWRPPG